MCGDRDFVMCDVPKTAMDLVSTAWRDFRDNPSDAMKFNSFDWALRVAVAKWHTYAETRRASSA